MGSRTAVTQYEVDAEIAELQEAYAEAYAAGNVDADVMAQAKDDWQRAYFLTGGERQWLVFQADGVVDEDEINTNAGTRAAHNYSGLMGYLDRAEAYARDGLAILGA